MNTESDAPNSPTPDWIPAAGIGMRKAGVLFDAVRVDGDTGRSLADLLVTLTGGDPGPIVTQCNGRRPTYFLIPVGGAAYRMWPEGFTRLTSGPLRSSYVPRAGTRRLLATGLAVSTARRRPPRARPLLLHRAAGLYQASCEISSKTTAHASAAGSISGK
ncbi:hypothetical protein [Streptomyces sp. NPDC058613]|uniref:hypothetical protein n=1 Tax=unclassified Streptomyces TaxID=2593676 RepID=UPI003652454A